MAQYKLSELVDGVNNVIRDSLEVDDKEIGLSTSLMDDLGAESLDYLDIIFRIEKTYKVKVERGRIEKELRAAFPDMSIKQNTAVTPEIAAVLKRALPEIAPDRIDSIQKIKELPATFTVATFVRFTVKALLDADPKTEFVNDLGPRFEPSQLGIA